MEITYAKAYKEVLVILEHLPKEEYRKIPTEEIRFYQENCDKEYKFELQKEIPLEKQDILKKTNAILVSIFRDYFATEIQKKKLNNILENNFKEVERERLSKYNPDNIFKNKISDNTKVGSNQVSLIEYKKENFLMKILSKIKNILKRR